MPFSLRLPEVTPLPDAMDMPQRPLPVSLRATGFFLPPAMVNRMLWPFEALAFTIFRVLSGGYLGKRPRNCVMQLIYTADLILRPLCWFAGPLIAVWQLFSGTLFTTELKFETDWYMYFVLAFMYAGMLIHLWAILWGRFSALPENVSGRTTTSPFALIFSFQSFDIDSAFRLPAAFTVSTINVLYTFGWVITLFEAAARSVSPLLGADTYRFYWVAAWLFFIVQNVVTALARSVSLDELRTLESPPKGTGPLSPSDSTRVLVVCIYVFWTLVFVLPLGLTSTFYMLI